MEMSPFFESDRACAGDLPADVAVDEGAGGGDWVEEFDAGTFLNPQVFTMHLADDFTMTADNQVARALDRTGDLSEDDEIVAAKCDAGNDAGFLNDDVATRLDSAVPDFVDFVV